jgi:hypothetical protein
MEHRFWAANIQKSETLAGMSLGALPQRQRKGCAYQGTEQQRRLATLVAVPVPMLSEDGKGQGQ